MRARHATTSRVSRSGGQWLLLVLLLALLGAATGCDITSFTGPAFVLPGWTVKYEVNIQSAASTPDPFDLHVLMRVPLTFSHTTSNYSGTVQSRPVSGTPTVSTSDPSAGCDFAGFVGSAPVGYQDIWCSGSFAGSDGPPDNGTLSAEFLVDANSASQQCQLLAATAYDDAGSGFCVETETKNVRVIAEPVPTAGPWGLVGLGVALAAAGTLGRRRLA